MQVGLFREDLGMDEPGRERRVAGEGRFTLRMVTDEAMLLLKTKSSQKQSGRSLLRPHIRSASLTSLRFFFVKRAQHSRVPPPSFRSYRTPIIVYSL